MSLQQTDYLFTYRSSPEGTQYGVFFNCSREQANSLAHYILQEALGKGATTVEVRHLTDFQLQGWDATPVFTVGD